MSEKLSVNYKEDIPKIIEQIIRVQGVHIVADIIEALLVHYNHDMLVEIVRNKSDTPIKSRNDFLTVGLNVYRYIFDNDYDMKVAIAMISDKSMSNETLKSMKESSIKNHLDKFRAKMREYMKSVNSKKYTDIDVKDIPVEDVVIFIYDFFRFYDNNDYPYWKIEYLKKGQYREAFNRFISIQKNGFDDTEIPF